MLVLWKDKITTGLSSKLYSMYSSILRAKKKNLLSNNLAAEVRKMINLFLAKFLGKAILCQKKKTVKNTKEPHNVNTRDKRCVPRHVSFQVDY